MTTRTCVTCIYKSGDYCTKQWYKEPRIEPVYGSKQAGRHYHCSTQRVHEHNSCGERGKWWAPISKQKEKPDAPRQAGIIGRAALRVLYLFRD